MPRFVSQVLIDQLQKDVMIIRQLADQHFAPLSEAQLLERPGPAEWSVAQCLEHLNTYGSYYLPLLEQAILQGEQSGSGARAFFRSGWLGNYFATSMRPGADGRIRLKAKAVKSHTPNDQPNAQNVRREFLRQQAQLESLLDRAKAVDLEGSRIPISIARWIKLSLGDTFRFLIAHEQRHVLQAQRVLKAVGISPTTNTPFRAS
ncbi:DinB family protein [Spirosoma oryzicola]|uniref:DinB family protein n=1 Tax=Spirosoma oryzicola TaxID=2898794 RepID=UPI001E4AADDF|nr:DinB family protein [Spirosoma oryzicola]UHG89159.1 DinB family protein [Spirosoma oryzicola]